MLKPQDIVALVGLQLLMRKGRRLVTLPELSAFIRLSGSETHAAVARLEQSQLLESVAMQVRQPLGANFLEFVEHGLRYVYPPELGPPTRGLATAAAAVPGLAVPGQLYVWPFEAGGAYGPALQPLYRSVPAACAVSSELHVSLAALDCLRIGRPRERQAGLQVLRELFSP